MSVAHAFYRAQSLIERSQMTHLPHQNSFNNPSEIAQYWRSQPPFAKHPDLFRLRLKHEQLAESAFELLTADNVQVSFEHISQPEWVSFFSEAFSSQVKSQLEPQEKKSGEFSHLPEITNKGIRTSDFLRVAEPLLLKGFNELKTQVTDIVHRYSASQKVNVTAICAQFYQELAARSAMICARAMVLELQISKIENELQGDTKEARYQYFIDGLNVDKRRQQLLSDYPVMARLIVETTLQWKANSSQLLTRLLQSWDRISATFSQGDLGVLSMIETCVGDTHKCGKTVSIIEFSCGLKVVYKPRSVAIETQFGRLLEWFNDKGFSPVFKPLKTLECGDYGWVEFAKHAPVGSIDGIKRFYQRQGGFLALLYALEANDFHYENIIASGEHPVLIDLETLFHPQLGYLNHGSKENAPDSALRNTVLSIGLLPRRIWTDQGESDGVDLSGFTEVQDQMTPTPVLDIENIGTDEMVFVRKKVPFAGAVNMPKLTGQTIRSIDYSDAVQAGFQQLYQILLKYRDELLSDTGPLSWFDRVETRVVFRDTRSYASFLLESLHSDFLGDALERDIFFDQLWVATEHKPYLGTLITFEQKALRQLDVPIFNTQANSRNLKVDDGTVLPDFFQNTGIERAKEKLSLLSESDLNRQIWVIRSALLSADLSNREAIHSSIFKKELKKPSDTQQLLNAAEGVSRAIEQLAFRSNNGASWFTWKAVGNSHWDLEAMGATLYDGLAGMLLFFAYAEHVTGQQRYREIAEETLNTARYLWREDPENIDDIGLFSGWGGLIYVLCHVAVLWDDERLLDEARELQTQIAERVNRDENNDIVGGCAGAIVALLILHDLRPDESTLNIAIQCGERLLARKVNQDKGVGWVLEIAGGKVLAGMSHGAAGISVALAMLHKATGDKKYLQVSRQAVEYERSLYSEAMENWPDLRVGSRPETSTYNDEYYYMTGWCHGAPGIGLARLRLSTLVDNNDFGTEIETAIKTTLKNGFNENHCLCHGSLGNLEVLLEASKILRDANYGHQAKELAAQIVDGQSETGWLSGFKFNLETPGFMVGLAGMGYQLLRICYPEKLPSILNLEAPLKRPHKRSG